MLDSLSGLIIDSSSLYMPDKPTRCLKTCWPESGVAWVTDPILGL